MQDSLMQENNQWMYTVSLHTATGTCQHSSLSKQSVLTKTLKKLLIKKLGQHDKILTKDQTIECELWPCKYELCIVYEKWFLVETKLKCFFTDEDLALLCMYCKCNVRVHDPNCAKGIDLNFFSENLRLSSILGSGVTKVWVSFWPEQSRSFFSDFCVTFKA